MGESHLFGFAQDAAPAKFRDAEEARELGVVETSMLSFFIELTDDSALHDIEHPQACIVACHSRRSSWSGRDFDHDDRF